MADPTQLSDPTADPTDIALSQQEYGAPSAPTTQMDPTNLDTIGNHIIGAQLASADQGDQSTLGDRVGNFVTKGIPLTAAAIFNSFYNTAVEVGNVFGAGAQKATISDEFGADSDYTKYYQQNTGLVEGLGLVAGSFLPGLGAVKILKLAQAGSFGERIAASTGLLSRISSGAMEAATADAAGNVTGTSLFGLNTISKAKTILYGAGDQALQGAVFQTAALATMKASPLLDENTIGDNVKSVIESAAGFGLLGGGVEGLGKLAQINRSVRAADLASKGAEISGSQGLGNLTPGDRIVKSFEGLDTAAQPTGGATDLTPLQARKLQYNTQATDVEISKALSTAAGGDKDVASAVQNFLNQGRNSGALDSDAVQNLMGQLTKIGRHGDTSIASQPNNAFFLPLKVDVADIPSIQASDILHPNATSAANPLGRAYSLTDPLVQPVIARATDTVGVPGSLQVPKFAGAQDAYNQGADIYIDAKGNMHVNSSATAFAEAPLPGTSRTLSVAERQQYLTQGTLPADSKPLNAVGTTLNLKTGTLFGESPLPVVGDIARPVATGSGLQVGEKFFPQKTGIDFSTVTNPMDANARYQWFLQKGVQDSTPIQSNDLPALEQLYRQKTVQEQATSKSGVAATPGAPQLFADTGTPIPDASANLLQHIADTKQTMMAQLIADGKNTDEIGHLLNAPDAGMSNMFASTDPAQLIRDTAGDADINHVRLAYDIGTTRNNQGDLLRGAQMTSYRLQLAEQARNDAVGNYLAKQFGGTAGVDTTQLVSRLQFTKDVGDANLLGAGPGLFTNANAEYGTLAQQAERIGATAGQLKTIQKSQIADTLASSANALRSDPEAAAEVGAFTAARHSTGENYVLLDDTTAAANGLGKNTVVLQGARQVDSATGAITIDRNYIPPGFATGGTPGNQLQTYYNLSDKALAWEQANQTLRNARNDLRSQFELSQGIKKPGYDPDVLYAPPINTQRYPFLAFVRQRPGTALGESGASVITARSAEELQGKISLLGPEYEAITKADVANFKAAQGEYEYNRNFNNSKTNAELQRKGILNNIVPESRAANIINDAASHHIGMNTKLLEDHIELHNAPTVAQLSDMGSRFTNTNTSFFGKILPGLQDTKSNPYQSYIDTMLNRSTGGSPLWQATQEKLEQYGNSAFNAVQQGFGAMAKGLIKPEEAAAIAEKFGLGNPYGTGIQAAQRYYGGLANALPNTNVLSKFVGTANSALGATVIRLDAMQQLIHAVTTPIMSAMEYAGATGGRAAGLTDLLSVTSPNGVQVPGFSRVMFRAIRNYFGPDSEALQKSYQAVGLTRDELQVHRQLIDQLTLPNGPLSQTGWAQKIDSATQLGQKLVGTNFVNRWNHFMAADIGRQLAEAQGLSGQEALDTIGTFVNRTLGNFAAGQRAQIFNGPVGQAIGLFQSYQMNMMQQLFRHVGNGDAKAVAIGAAMQSSIFGLSSLPGFHALNQLVASQPGNTSHGDLFSGLHQMLGDKTANYLLYGGLSNVLGSALYSRGDLNPRRASILPTDPMQFPAVAAGVRTYDLISQLTQQLSSGASVPSSLLLAAEHNGLSRPLAGLSELIQGFSTNPKGDMIATLQDPANQGSGTSQNVAGYSDMFSLANMSRLLGARPLDEAIGMDTLYQSNAMKTLDRARLEELGEAAKVSLRNGGQLAPDQVQQMLGSYARAGGNQVNFSSWLLGEAKNANTSVVNKAFGVLGSPRNQTVQQKMGGVPLPDYQNTGSTQGAQVENQ